MRAGTGRVVRWPGPASWTPTAAPNHRLALLETLLCELVRRVQSRLRLRVTAKGRERTHGPFVHCAHGRSLFASFSTWRRLGRAGGGGRPERLVGQNHKLSTGPDRLIGSAPTLTVRKKEPGKASPKPVRSLCASPDVEEPRQGGYRARGPNDVHGQACATLLTAQ
jgi:hypothetical protein